MVTLTNENESNIQSLVVLVRSLLMCVNPVPEALTVLCADEQVESRLKQLLPKQINIKRYNLKRTSDVYFVKFLLNEYVFEYPTLTTEILYIDPDHVCLRNFQLSTGNGLHVSSELHTYEKDDMAAVESIFPAMQFNSHHFNTSFICGHSDLWRRLALPWRNAYEKIVGKVDFRHREEIAYTAGCGLSNIPCEPVSPTVQSNFSIFSPECSLFHYGGDYESAKKLKALMRDADTRKARLTAMLRTSSTDVEAFIARAMLDLI